MSTVDLAHDRIINGLLKGHDGALSPQDLAVRLNTDVVIRCVPSRCTADDLWPAVWALASVISRQIFGRVYIEAGITESLPAPVPLGPRCEFRPCPATSPLVLELGARTSPVSIAGDACKHAISLDPIDGPKPTPIECFLLAGYLGFCALAKVAQIPETRIEYAVRALQVSYDPMLLHEKLIQRDGFTFVGLGQVGQASLSLLWFLYRGNFDQRRIALIDDDKFGKENQRTQILLVEGASWLNQEKAIYMSSIADLWNANAIRLPKKIEFGWQRGNNPAIAFVGTHDFESRRMACTVGFEEIIECGVGTDLMAPRVSWSMARGDTRQAKSLFHDRPAASNPEMPEMDWVKELKETPGKCGWVQFEGISATAPCLGIAAAAYALAESANAGLIRQGGARMWGQLLPTAPSVVRP